MQPRTKRQKEIFEYISTFIETRGYKPSYQQIAKHFQLASKAAVAKHIESLEKQGLISRRRDNGSFSLELNRGQSAQELISEIEWLEVPEKNNAIEDYFEEKLLVPTFFIGMHQPEKLSAFLVRNDAMVDEHICEGDIVLIEKRTFARDGDIVVAEIKSEYSVLKRIFRNGPNVELHPSNQNYSILNFSADEVEVRGVYRGLLRPCS